MADYNDPFGSAGPNGIPDPANPGYDTNGYPIAYYGLGGQDTQSPDLGMPNPSDTGPTTFPPPPAGMPATPPSAGAPDPTGGTDPAGGGNTGGGGGLIDPFTQPAPTWQDAPAFHAPTFTPGAAFQAPTIDQALNDPGYAFALQQGEQALQNSAAAGGVLNIGNTLKNILGYGQNLATTHYNDLFNRDLTAYQQNYQTQTLDPYKFAYQSAMDTFQPQFASWAQKNNFDYNTWLQNYNMFRNRQLDTVAAANATS